MTGTLARERRGGVQHPFSNRSETQRCAYSANCRSNPNDSVNSFGLKTSLFQVLPQEIHWGHGV